VRPDVKIPIFSFLKLLFNATKEPASSELKIGMKKRRIKYRVASYGISPTGINVLSCVPNGTRIYAKIKFLPILGTYGAVLS
jgi:hypothetical protein